MTEAISYWWISSAFHVYFNNHDEMMSDFFEVTQFFFSHCLFSNQTRMIICWDMNHLKRFKTQAAWLKRLEPRIRDSLQFRIHINTTRRNFKTGRNSLGPLKVMCNVGPFGWLISGFLCFGGRSYSASGISDISRQLHILRIFNTNSYFEYLMCLKHIT